MPEFTVKNVIQECAWLAPEVFEDEQFMEEWSQKYWGVGYKQLLKADDDD